MDSDSDREVNHSDDEEDIDDGVVKNKNKQKAVTYNDDSDEEDDEEENASESENEQQQDSDKEVEEPEESEKEMEEQDDEDIPQPKIQTLLNLEEDDEKEDDDEDDEDNFNYLQKFDINVNKNYVNEFHPECLNHNYDEIEKLTTIVKDENNNIIDPFHKTVPFLTKYEKTRVIGQRAKQIEEGANPFIKVPENVIEGYIIAEMELKEKKIPFIIRRPVPGGAFEYWKLRDLEIIAF